MRFSPLGNGYKLGLQGISIGWVVVNFRDYKLIHKFISKFILNSQPGVA
jgi:hypothetical protein